MKNKSNNDYDSNNSSDKNKKSDSSHVNPLLGDLNPCQFNHGCFGCCGHDFEGKEDIAEALRKNTFEYQDEPDKYKFLMRENFLRKCGICYNLGKQPNGKIGCLVYDIDGKDRRIDNGCEIDFECKTFFEFKQWDKSKQMRFKKFAESIDLDWYQFSVMMDDGTLLKIFQKHEEKITK